MEKAGKIVKKAAFIIFVVFFVGIIVLPFFWQFMTSIKPLSELQSRQNGSQAAYTEIFM